MSGKLNVNGENPQKKLISFKEMSENDGLYMSNYTIYDGENRYFYSDNGIVFLFMNNRVFHITDEMSWVNNKFFRTNDEITFTMKND